MSTGTPIMERAKPIARDTATVVTSFALGRKKPTRRQRILGRIKKFGIPALVLGGAGTIAGIFIRRSDQSPSTSGSSH